MSTATLDQSALSVLVDEFGQLKAKLAELESVEKMMRAVLVESGMDVIEGDLFKVNVSRFEKNQVDWKGLAEAMKPSPQRKAAYTEVKDMVVVKAVSR